MLDKIKGLTNTTEIITPHDLGNTIGAKCCIYFNSAYSYNFFDYYKHIKTEYQGKLTHEDEAIFIYKQHITMKKKGYNKLVIAWYYVEIYKKDVYIKSLYLI